MEHYYGTLEGFLDVVKTTNTVSGAVDYLLKLTLGDGTWLLCHGTPEVRKHGLQLIGTRVMVEGWILPSEQDESPLLVAADSIQPA